MEPWATILLFGEKPVENRRWHTHHRGDLAIHAGVSRTWLNHAPVWAIEYMNELGGPHFGLLLGVLRVTDCVGENEARARFDRHLHPYISGPECWVVDQKRRFAEFVQMQGQRGLFTLPADILLPDLIDISPRSIVSIGYEPTKEAAA